MADALPLRSLSNEHSRHGTAACCMPRSFYLPCVHPLTFVAIAVPTPLFDNTGIAHTLEHLVIAGSSRHAALIDLRSLERNRRLAFVRACTYVDRTLYYGVFDSESSATDGYSHLLDITHAPAFLRDSSVFPSLIADGELSPLSEMKRTFARRNRKMLHILKSHIFAGTRYAYDSGGIPDLMNGLTLGELEVYFLRHYNTSATMLLFMNVHDEGVFRDRTAGETWGYSQPPNLDSVIQVLAGRKTRYRYGRFRPTTLIWGCVLLVRVPEVAPEDSMLARLRDEIRVRLSANLSHPPPSLSIKPVGPFHVVMITIREEHPDRMESLPSEILKAVELAVSAVKTVPISTRSIEVSNRIDNFLAYALRALDRGFRVASCGVDGTDARRQADSFGLEIIASCSVLLGDEGLETVFENCSVGVAL